jgi:hypothetical protein
LAGLRRTIFTIGAGTNLIHIQSYPYVIVTLAVRQTGPVIP